MMDEISLHNKINILQSKMLKFHERMSPPKSPESSNVLSPYFEDVDFTSASIEIAFVFLKICVCLLGPAVFPAIVFCIEGRSRLFWQVTATCSALTLVLALATLTMLHASAAKLKRRVEDTITSLLCRLNDPGVLQSTRSSITSSEKSAHVTAYFLILILVCIPATYLSYSKKPETVFCVSLMSTGFVLGVLTSILFYNFSNAPTSELPTRDKQKVEFHVTAPSPELQRNLNCGFAKSREPKYEWRISQPDVLPYTYAQAIQSITQTRTLHVPFDFKKLLRRLSF